jgi:hypothetical protein
MCFILLFKPYFVNTSVEAAFLAKFFLFSHTLALISPEEEYSRLTELP